MLLADLEVPFLAAAFLGGEYAQAEIALGAVRAEVNPLRTGWSAQPQPGTVFEEVFERPFVAELDSGMAASLATWWEAGYSTQFDALQRT